MREFSLGPISELRPSIPDVWAREIERVGAHVTLDKGRVLYRQGDVADRIFLLKSGRIKSTSVNAVGTETVLRIHISGSLVGLTAIGAHPVRDATATAQERSRLTSVNRPEMLELMHQHGPFGIYIAQLLLARLSSFQFRVHEVMANTVEQRVARALLGFCLSSGQEPSRIPLSHEEISQIVAARRPTVTETLRQFAEAGLVRLERRKIEVVDPAGLAKLLPWCG